MKTTLLTICLLLFTTQVFAEPLSLHCKFIKGVGIDFRIFDRNDLLYKDSDDFNIKIYHTEHYLSFLKEFDNGRFKTGYAELKLGQGLDFCYDQRLILSDNEIKIYYETSAQEVRTFNNKPLICNHRHKRAGSIVINRISGVMHLLENGPSKAGFAGFKSANFICSKSKPKF